LWYWLAFGRLAIWPRNGIDLAADVIAAAQSRSPYVNFIAGDFFQISLPNGYYDLVVSQEVIAISPIKAHTSTVWLIRSKPQVI
jgi:trans-aconitate methyltransferase